MKKMKEMSLPTQGSKKHLSMLFLEVNKKNRIFGFLFVFMWI